MSEVRLEGLCKSFGGVAAVTDIHLTVAEGEFLTLLGPSGCGKSTTLMSIAGLEVPDAGRILVDGRPCFDSAVGLNLAPERRNCGLVFQSYALWPHMTVAQNVEFPLKLRHLPKRVRRDMVHEALSLVELDALGDRYPHQLSGGQQQRAALARTLAYKPSVLLLDEPLSNLDARLRARARSWLKDLQRQVGLTTIYVTHDQIEALALSDRIAVMNGGRIVQLDAPPQIYRRPASAFVADFVGASNFIRGELATCANELSALKTSGGGTIRAGWNSSGEREGPALLAIRPEDVSLSEERPHDPSLNVLKGRIVDQSYQGSSVLYSLQTLDGVIHVQSTSTLSGPEVWASFSPTDAVILSV